MDNDYIYIMQRKENLCKAYLQKAEYEFTVNGCHTNNEGKYLQEAAKLQYEMAQISDGEARKYHQRRQKEINNRVAEVCKAVAPDTYMRIMKEREAAINKSAAAGKDFSSEAKKNTSANNNDEEAADEAITTWFKPMPVHSFADVAGMNELKEQLKECIEDARLTEIRRVLKMRQLHSFFFIGPPGCGKTYIIEAFAHELMEKEYKYLSLDGSDILSRFVGDAEKTISRLFEEAEKNAPCIVFIDEVDGVCKNRSLPDLPDWAASITTAFLTSYNRINSSDKQIIFIGATNYPNQVDNAMMDRVQLIRVPFPDEEAREHAFRLQFEPIVELEPDFTYEEMAELTDEYNYRDIDRLSERIKNLILKDVLELYADEKQAIEAIQNRDYFLTRDTFLAAQADYTPTPKDAIKKELADFEARFTKKQENDG